MKRATQIVVVLLGMLLLGTLVSLLFAQQPRRIQCAIVHPITRGVLAVDGGDRPVILAYFHRGIGDSLYVPQPPDALLCTLVAAHPDTLRRSQ